MPLTIIDSLKLEYPPSLEWEISKGSKQPNCHVDSLSLDQILMIFAFSYSTNLSFSPLRRMDLESRLYIKLSELDKNRDF